MSKVDDTLFEGGSPLMSERLLVRSMKRPAGVVLLP
jgi:hypothetical protein